MSFPGEFPVIRVNLKASAPYFSTTSIGSTPFPRDLLIFLPWLSLIRPVNNTWEKGTFPVVYKDANTILITQKKIIS